MACEKYTAQMKDLIADAAFGALAPGREPEFLAHAAECGSCREAYKHAREVAAFVDRGVESLVNGAPSPHFNTRLRARITAEPASARFHWTAWATAASALAFTTILLILLTHGGHALNPRTTIPVAGQSQPSSPPSVALDLPSQPAATELPPSPRLHQVIRRAVPRSNEPEVLVQPGEFAAVLQYADALRSGRIDGEQIVAAQQLLDEPLEVAPIEIPLLDAPSNESGAAKPSENSGRF
jgi:hypothetical protein